MNSKVRELCLSRLAKYAKVVAVSSASVLARSQPSKDCEIVPIGTAAETSKRQGSLAPSLLDADWINYLFIKNLEPSSAAVPMRYFLTPHLPSKPQIVFLTSLFFLTRLEPNDAHPCVILLFLDAVALLVIDRLALELQRSAAHKCLYGLLHVQPMQMPFAVV